MLSTRRGLFWPSCCAVIALVVAGLHPVDNPDSFGHLAAGRQIVELGHVPSLDTFSYYRPAPQPWVNYEWLSDWLMFEVLRGTGVAGLNAWKLLLIAGVAVLLTRLAFERAGAWGARLCALSLIAAVPALRFRLSVRPHMFGLLLSAVYWVGLLQILEAGENPARRSRVWRWVIGLGCAHVAWVNLHGSHLLGLALTLIATAVSVRRPGARGPLASLLGLELVASCISPYGPRIVVGAIDHVFDPRYRMIVGEWQAWTPAQPAWFAIGVALQAVLVALAWRGLRANAAGWFMRLSALLLVVMAARSLRFSADFLALSSPLVAEGLVFEWQRWQRAREAAGAEAATRVGPRTSSLAWWFALAAVSGSAFVLSLGLPPYAAFGFGADLRTLPAASAAWLARERPRARVFAAMEDGWFLMWGAPTVRVLMDGRVPFYGPEHMFAMSHAFGNGAELQRLIRRSATTAVIVQPTVTEQQVAFASMRDAAQFALVVIENTHALYVQRGAGNLREFRALRPGYDAQWLLAQDADLDAIRSELAWLRVESNAGAYVAWVDALLALRPLARAQGEAGFAAPVTAGQRDAARFALRKLRPLRAVLEDVPSLSAYHALAAVLACDLDEAERVLSRIRREDVSRESTFASQELALRRGDLASVHAFVEAARRVPQAAGDGWLAALSGAPVACP